MNHALVIVDVQLDFCPGGPLATDMGDVVAHRIAEHVRENSYDKIVATVDWHIDPGDHFSPNPDFIDSWPVHCVAESAGAQIHPILDDVVLDAVFKKGRYTAAYSGFEGFHGYERLDTWLKSNNIDRIDVVGIATDYCVRETVLDGLTTGFDVNVDSRLCAPISIERGNAALEDMRRAGATVKNHYDRELKSS